MGYPPKVCKNRAQNFGEGNHQKVLHYSNVRSHRKIALLRGHGVSRQRMLRAMPSWRAACVLASLAMGRASACGDRDDTVRR